MNLSKNNSLSKNNWMKSDRVNDTNYHFVTEIHLY
jgi:hypothetical protein